MSPVDDVYRRPEPDPIGPCRHCEDGESPEGHCTCRAGLERLVDDTERRVSLAADTALFLSGALIGALLAGVSTLATTIGVS